MKWLPFLKERHLSLVLYCSNKLTVTLKLYIHYHVWIIWNMSPSVLHHAILISMVCEVCILLCYQCSLSFLSLPLKSMLWCALFCILSICPCKERNRFLQYSRRWWMKITSYYKWLLFDHVLYLCILWTGLGISMS